MNWKTSVFTNMAAEGGPGNIPSVPPRSLEAEWFALCVVRTFAWKSEQSHGTGERCLMQDRGEMPGQDGGAEPQTGASLRALSGLQYDTWVIVTTMKKRSKEAIGMSARPRDTLQVWPHFCVSSHHLPDPVPLPLLTHTVRSCLCLLPRAWKERDVSYEARLGGAASHCPLLGLVLVPSPASRESPGPRPFPVMVCPPNVSLSFSVSLCSASSGSLPSWVRCLRGEPRSCYLLQRTPLIF